MKRILKITGSSFAYIYTNPYTARSGGKGGLKALSYPGGSLFCQVSVGPVLLGYVYQFCPLGLHTSRRYLNVPNPEF